MERGQQLHGSSRARSGYAWSESEKVNKIGKQKWLVSIHTIFDWDEKQILRLWHTHTATQFYFHLSAFAVHSVYEKSEPNNLTSQQSLQ